MQMAAVISAIANGGTLYALQYPRTPEELAAFQPVVRRHLDNLAGYIPQIRDGLAGSVLYGTGRSAYDPDLSIYGKTGTCSENGARLGWFMSYAGEPQSKYVAVVLLRGGRMMYGPHAAEIAGHFYRDLMQKEHPTQASRRIPPRLHPGDSSSALVRRASSIVIDLMDAKREAATEIVRRLRSEGFRGVPGGRVCARHADGPHAQGLRRHHQRNA